MTSYLVTNNYSTRDLFHEIRVVATLLVGDEKQGLHGGLNEVLNEV